MKEGSSERPAGMAQVQPTVVAQVQPKGGLSASLAGFPRNAALRLPADLVDAGLCGVHPLFELAEIRRSFARLPLRGFSVQSFQAAHRALCAIMGSDGTAHTRRAYVAQLPGEVLDVVVYVYFRTLDQLAGAGRTLH